MIARSSVKISKQNWLHDDEQKRRSDGQYENEMDKKIKIIFPCPFYNTKIDFYVLYIYVHF